MKNHKTGLLALLSSALLVAAPAQAQDFSSDPDWKITAYLWTLGLEGDLGIGPIQEDIDLSFGDLLSELDIGGAVVFRRDQGAHTLILDAQYYSLSPEESGPLGGTIDTKLKLPIISASYGYKWGEPDRYGMLMGGVRYLKTDLKLTLTPSLPGPLDPVIVREADPDFTDIFAGFMGAAPISDNWFFLGQVDYGAGGSNGTWNAIASFQHRNQSGNHWGIGFRVMGVDFDDTLPNGELFAMDTTMAGLLFNFTWD